ncbi:MAG: hypothetical protein AB7E80_05290 [Hyphomicrobiaceae bacterium]
MTEADQKILYGPPRPDGTVEFWRMRTIWAAAEGGAVVAVRIDELSILDEVVWFGGPRDVRPTVRKVAERARDIFAADISFPIIMTSAGEVLDGAHRIARAYLQGLETLSAIVIDDWPEPDGFVPAKS